jgi:hypothetical protein
MSGRVVNMSRLVDVGRLALGAALVLRPDLASRLTPTDTGNAAVADAVADGGPDVAHGSRVRLAARVLGIRYLGQAGLGLLVRGRWVASLDTAVELLHGATMVAAAIRWPVHRRPAAASASVAILFAAADIARRPASCSTRR